MGKMKILFAVFACILVTLTAEAQDGESEQRANHYLDHIVLGINDLQAGIQEFKRLTGISPRKDGSDAMMGTHSAIVGLGDDRFLEIVAPDPDADPDLIDPVLNKMYTSRLSELEELTPFRWGIGTSNLTRSRFFIDHASNRPSEIQTGSRKRSWGRMENWDWSWILLPESRVTPIFVQWADESKRPQERAPDGCTLEELHVRVRSYKSVLNLLAAVQVRVNLSGSDDESLQFDLVCDGEEISFESPTLSDRIIPPPNRN